MTSIDQLYQHYLQHPVISTDTRRIAPGSLFFALKGDKFDANTFSHKAIEAGAAYAIIDNPEYAAGDQFLLVDDVLTTLQNLARHHRRQLDIPVIGLTGTNGKTTTKELINAVLSQKFKTLATQGNLNNHIGVPLTILTIDRSHQMAVIEMGANHQQEIALLCSIAQPTHGLITNVGKAHLEGFGGVEGVKKGKGELYDYLKLESLAAESKIAFVNSDDAILLDMQKARDLKDVIYYGKNGNPANLVSGKLLDNSPYLTFKWHDKKSSSYNVKSQLTGSYNLDNILAAACIGSFFGLDSDEINQGIEGYQPKNNRSQLTKTATNTLICDFYNANPSSMFVAIENMDKVQAGHKVLILGDMFEMGDESAAEHTAVIQKAMGANVDERIFIGKDFASQQTEVENTNLINTTFYMTAEDAITGLKANPITNATILIKGSRGMALERLVELF
jgi:UDP-N-acetylmuramoyl-tripeptide--D-alanyl-D-alanine ligase